MLQVAIGFDSGYFVVMGNLQEAPDELFSHRLHTGKLASIAISNRYMMMTTLCRNDAS